MKAITWLASFTAVAITASAFAAPEGWLDDFDQALAKAKDEKKPVLLEFTGSDWCPPCIALSKNVFSKKEFMDSASQKFVLVKLDFPRGNKVLSEKNEPFAQKFKIDGFPTVVLLDSEGKEFTRFYGGEHPTVEKFLKHLDEALEKKNLD